MYIVIYTLCNIQYLSSPSECVFMRNNAGELWGELTPNGSWSGMVGLFARGEGDIGVANLFITALGGRREFQEYTTPYGQEVGGAFFVVVRTLVIFTTRQKGILSFTSVILN